jgi:hypothetical protein
MPAVGSLDRIHRESANGVGEAAVGWLHKLRRSGLPAQDSGPDAAPLAALPVASNRTAGDLPGIMKVLSEPLMADSELSSALDRAERALQRIEQALANRQPAAGPDDQLRAKVREVVEELDELIREAAA